MDSCKHYLEEILYNTARPKHYLEELLYMARFKYYLGEILYNMSRSKHYLEEILYTARSNFAWGTCCATWLYLTWESKRYTGHYAQHG